MKPSVGQIVIFCREGFELAAVITKVHGTIDNRVELFVFPCADRRAAVPDHTDTYMIPEGPRLFKKYQSYWKWAELASTYTPV